MKLYYFTFGQKYRKDEVHPQGGHPDGWFTIEAINYAAAREKMHTLCGEKWASQYAEEPSRKMLPLGELKRL